MIFLSPFVCSYGALKPPFLMPLRSEKLLTFLRNCSKCTVVDIGGHGVVSALIAAMFSVCKFLGCLNVLSESLNVAFFSAVYDRDNIWRLEPQMSKTMQLSYYEIFHEDKQMIRLGELRNFSQVGQVTRAQDNRGTAQVLASIWLAHQPGEGQGSKEMKGLHVTLGERKIACLEPGAVRLWTNAKIIWVFGLFCMSAVQQSVFSFRGSTTTNDPEHCEGDRLPTESAKIYHMMQSGDH
ncbi:uncharacterized protein BDR25DRAFT_351427 [Lindgomyces ingoldianus]|uniref:Uncharacterized protein n=1 Tax=Lindgomyces ingoldianus TaxID=673940 RepID=A0ACB6R6Z0_9PLEO|nr:uncharacterized protein BDR25DRAFT_351427 [Lindgomyces ingoldianus]KAF2474946.1 hypothetical protein BDR25DRAFT_351427 [Lindgomyces ingoldianus]